MGYRRGGRGRSRGRRGKKVHKINYVTLSRGGFRL